MWSYIYYFYFQFLLLKKLCFIQLSSVTQSCLTLCDSMDCRTPGLPVHHQLLEFTQTHDHWVGEAIQPSHPLSSPSPIFDLSQHQGLFQWLSSLHQVAKVLEFQLQHHPSNEYSGVISFKMDWLDLLAVQRTQESFPTPQFSGHWEQQWVHGTFWRRLPLSSLPAP